MVFLFRLVVEIIFLDDEEEKVDEDVQQEEEMLSTEFNSLDAPVIIFQLRKEVKLMEAILTQLVLLVSWIKG